MMKDLHPHRLIRITATSVLALSIAGCGGKKEEDDEDKVPEKREALGDFCSATQECVPSEFDSEYEDVDDCVEDSSMNYEDVVEEQGEECGESMLKLLSCLGETWPETCDIYDAAEDCIPEALGASSDCDELPTF